MCIKMEESMRENGKKINLKEKVYSLIKMEVSMMVILKMDNMMAMEQYMI